MSKKIKNIILLFLIVPFLFFSFYAFKVIKRNYIRDDYFKQGRWEILKKKYNKMPKNKYSSILFGDSMTENIFHYLPKNSSFIDMGISGDYSIGLINRVENVVDFQPNNVFIMIGINDIIEKFPLSEIQTNYEHLIQIIQKKCPNTKIYIQSTLPTCGRKSLLSSSEDVNLKVIELNTFLKNYAKSQNIVFIDMYPDFVNQNNELKPELTTEGIHLNALGYEIWLRYLKKYTD